MAKVRVRLDCSITVIKANKIKHRLFILYCSLPQNPMQLVTHSKPLGKSIKDKKNSIINHQSQSPFLTPKKQLQQQEAKTTEKKKQYHSIGMRVRSRNDESTYRKNNHIDGDARSEPKNAFNKKCFQKKRTIMPIQDLLERQASLSQSKRIVPFRSCNRSLDSSKNSVRSYSKFLDGKKGVADPHAQNLARRGSTSREKRSISSSKKIKASIMGQNHC